MQLVPLRCGERHLDRVSRGVDVGVLGHDRRRQPRDPPVTRRAGLCFTVISSYYDALRALSQITPM
jgi:hypothetical protein